MGLQGEADRLPLLQAPLTGLPVAVQAQLGLLTAGLPRALVLAAVGLLAPPGLPAVLLQA